MILDVAERLATLSVLPREGNYATLKILRELRMNLSFTESELEEWEIVSNLELGLINWGTNGEAEIPIGEIATGIIVDALRKLDGQSGLEEHMMDIYEKFIPTT